MIPLSAPAGTSTEYEDIRIPPHGLPGVLRLPRNLSGLVIFAHDSSSSRFSPRNAMLADTLNENGLATLMFDMLTPQIGNSRVKVLDVSLLAQRLIDTVRWVDKITPLRIAPIGFFATGTGSAAALEAAAALDGRIAAIVSRGGRPDLANDTAPRIVTPTMFIVGGTDNGVIEQNEQVYARIRAPKKFVVVNGATQSFSERGTLEQVAVHAGRWFDLYLKTPQSRDNAANLPAQC